MKAYATKSLSVIFGVLLMTSAAYAEDTPEEDAKSTKGWVGQGKSIGVKDIIPQLSTEEAYTERYTLRVDVDGGGWIGTEFTISNLGWGNGHGGAQVRIELPNQKKYKFKKKVSKDDWTSAKDKLDLNIAKTQLTSTDGKTYRLQHSNGDVSLDITFTNTLPMWAPGRGQIDVKDGYFKYHILSPRASVSGTAKVNGKTYKIKSTAKSFIDHVATNVAPFDFAKRFSRFRRYEKDVTIIWREVQLAKKYGGQTLTWVMVGYKNQLVFDDAQANIRFGKTQKDMSTGYVAPFAVQVDGSKNKDKIKLIMYGKKVTKSDLLKRYGSAAKLVASAVSKPFRYSFDGTFVLQMTIQGVTATVKGNGNYTIDYVNP